MYSLTQLFSLLIGLFVLSSCTSTSALVDVPTRSGAAVEAPVYKTGESWIYRVIRDGGTPEELRVTYKNDKFESNHSETLSGAIWVTVLLNDSDFEPLDFPLIPGKTWNYTYRRRSSRGRTNWRDAEVKVVGPVMQPVKTAAGQFKAVEIQRYETWATAVRSTTYFYSPETKSVVKLIAGTKSRIGESHYEMELMKYSAGK